MYDSPKTPALSSKSFCLKDSYSEDMSYALPEKRYGSISLISLLKAKSCADSSFLVFVLETLNSHDSPYDIRHHLQSV